ncbi:MAG: GIY-YIG nuclease family protein [Bacteroidales bacterium]|nr:GIY-YIG nuclease family protein [Bacteroidales bacterium]
MKYFVYILKSEKNESFYIGQTNNLSQRIDRHNKGFEKYTKKFTPWKLFFSTELDSRAKAITLERKLKNLKSRKKINEWIKNFKQNS